MHINKKSIIILLATIAILTTTITTTTAADDGTNINLSIINFTVPQTSTGNITDAKDMDGGMVWTYYDKEHDITIYVCENDAPEYSTQEKWDEVNGYNQKYVLDGRTVVLCCKNSGDKDSIYKSMIDLNA